MPFVLAGSLTLMAWLAATGCGDEPLIPQEAESLERVVKGQGLVIRMPPGTVIGPGVNPEFLRLNYHSFGRVPLGEKVSHVFLLENTDDQPLTVKSMKPACGCTTPKLSYMQDGEPVIGRSAISRSENILTIPAGVTAELEVVMDSHSVPITNIDKTVGVMLTTDSPNGYYLHVETHIFVEKPFTQNPSGINFNLAPVSGITNGSTDLIQNPGYDQVLTSIASMPEGMQAELIYSPLGGKNIWRLEAQLLPPREMGNWTGSIFIHQESMDGKALEPLEVRMSARGVDDLLFTPSRCAFRTQMGNGETSGSLSLKLESLLAGHAFGIEQLIMISEHRELFEVSFESLSPDSEGRAGAWSISLGVKPGVSITELTRGTLRILLDDPQHPETQVDYVIHPPLE